MKPGIPVGVSLGDNSTVQFGNTLLSTPHLYIGEPGTGKTTLTEHVVVGMIAQKARGHFPDPVVVIDPEGHLVSRLLMLVPQSLEGRVHLLDLVDINRVPSVNPLASDDYCPHDEITRTVTDVLQELGDTTSPQTEVILSRVVSTLSRYNLSPMTRSGDELTLLYGSHLLRNEAFRQEVLSRVEDRYLAGWWRHEYNGAPFIQRRFGAPLAQRIERLTASESSRVILGQSQWSVPVESILGQGDILLVSLGIPHVSKEAASLIAAATLTRILSFVRRCQDNPDTETPSVRLAIDNASHIAGLKIESLVPEIGRLGSSVLMNTDVLSDDRHWQFVRESILANTGCLCLFEAQPDLREHVLGMEDDLVAAPQSPYECRAYIRAEGQRQKIQLRINPPSTDISYSSAITPRRFGSDDFDALSEQIPVIMARRVKEITAGQDQ